MWKQHANSRSAPDTLLVLPTERWAREEQQRVVAARGSVPAGIVVSVSHLADALARPDEASIGPAEVKAILFQMLLASPAKYAGLVGKGERGAFVSRGLLDRVAEAVGRLLRMDALPKPRNAPGSPAGEILELARALEKHLAAGKVTTRHRAVKTAWKKLDAKRFAVALPDVGRVVFDGFDVFEDATFLAVTRLGELCAECIVLLDFDPASDGELFPHLTAAWQRLSGVAGRVETTPAGNEPASPAPPLRSVVRAASREEEVRAIASHIRARMHEAAAAGGEFRFEDHLVCFPALERYAPLVREVFRDFNIPFVLSTGSNLEREPAWELVECLDAAVSSGAAADAVHRLVCSPLLTTESGAKPDIRILERARREIGFTGRGSQFLKSMRARIGKLSRLLKKNSAQGPEESAEPEYGREYEEYCRLEKSFAELLDVLAGLDGKKTPDEWAKALDLAVARLVVGTSLTRVAGHSAGEMARFKRSLERISGAARSVSACAPLPGGSGMRFDGFVALMEFFVRGEKVPGHVALAGGVEVVGRLEVRGQTPKTLYVGGLVDGEFPRVAMPRQWAEELAPAAETRETIMSEQRFLFRVFLDTPSGQLFLMVPGSDGDEQLLPSQFLEDHRIFPTCVEMDARELAKGGDGFSAAARIASVVSFAEPRGKTGKRGTVSATLPLEMCCLRNIAWNIEANAQRRRMDAVGSFDGFISDAVLRDMLLERAANRVFSPTQLDVLIGCRFRFYVERVLGVREAESAEEEFLSPMVIGQVAHSALFRFYSAWVGKGNDKLTAQTRAQGARMLADAADSALDDAPIDDFTRAYIERRLYGFAGRQAFLDGVDSPADGTRGRIIAGHIGLLGGFLKKEIERCEANLNLLSPRYFEISFGFRKWNEDDERDGFSQDEPVRLNLGKTSIGLLGKADRIDTGNGMFSLIDYKTGAVPTIREQQAGQRVQIPVYVMAFRQIFAERGLNLSSAGGFYYQLKPDGADCTGQLLRKAAKPFEALAEKAKLLEDDAFEDALAVARENIAAGVSDLSGGRFHVTLLGEKQCTYCPCERICRKDLARTESLLSRLTGNTTGRADKT